MENPSDTESFFLTCILLIRVFSAKEDSDFVEMYCGNEMLKRLGYDIPGDTESRTVDNVDNRPKEPTLTPVDGVATNSSKEETPNVMSDLSNNLIYSKQ